MDRFRHHVIPAIALHFNWHTILSCFNQDFYRVCAWSEIGAWVVEKPQVIRDLDFAELTWILQELNILSNFRGTAGDRCRVVVGYDIGSRLVVIDRVFTSIFCLC